MPEPEVRVRDRKGQSVEQIVKVGLLVPVSHHNCRMMR